MYYEHKFDQDTFHKYDHDFFHKFDQDTFHKFDQDTFHKFDQDTFHKFDQDTFPKFDQDTFHKFDLDTFPAILKVLNIADRMRESETLTGTFRRGPTCQLNNLPKSEERKDHLASPLSLSSSLS